MAQFLNLLPTLGTGPFMRMLRIHSTGCIEIAIGFLRPCHNHQHTVNIILQFFIGISLQQIAGTLNGFIHIGIIERKASHMNSITRMRCIFEITIAACLLTLAKR